MADKTMRCGYGIHGRHQCELTIADSEFKTMESAGWGWVLQFDPGMPEGVEGWYATCPEHSEYGLDLQLIQEAAT